MHLVGGGLGRDEIEEVEDVLDQPQGGAGEHPHQRLDLGHRRLLRVALQQRCTRAPRSDHARPNTHDMQEEGRTVDGHKARILLAVMTTKGWAAVSACGACVCGECVLKAYQVRREEGLGQVAQVFL